MNKSIGLPFKAELVPKVLDGSKSQTRRLPGIHNCRLLLGNKDMTGKMRGLDWNKVILGYNVGSELVAPPHPLTDRNPDSFQVWHPEFQRYLEIVPRHKPGDIAWMRETWRKRYIDAGPEDRESGIQYKADGMYLCEPTWKSSIHMFRWASRWERPLKSVRIELIQDITGRDCVFEGIVPEYEVVDGLKQWKGGTRAVRQRFAELWDSINASRNWAWELNRPIIVFDWSER